MQHLPLLERERFTIDADLIVDASLERFESIDNLGIAAYSRTGGRVGTGESRRIAVPTLI